MVDYLPVDLLKTLRSDDFNAQANNDMAPLQSLLAPSPKAAAPESTPQPVQQQPVAQPQQQAPSFSLPTWDQFKLGAEQAGQTIQQGAQQVQQQASQFKLPDWTSFQLPGTSAAQPEAGAASASETKPAGAGVALPSSAPAAGPSGPVDTSSPDAFLNTLHPYSQQASAKTGVPASVLTAIAANESGYGKYPAGGVQGNNNFFGIKGKESGTWSSFDSPQEGLDWVANMFATDPRYAKAMANKDNADAFVQELANAGYIQPDEASAWVGQVQSLSKQAAAIAPVAQARTASPQQASIVDQAALDDPDKWALCGPVAAVLAAAAHGADWTVAQAKGIATKLGLWDAGNGMHGLDSEVQLLKQAGVNATTGAADEQRLAQDAQNGNTPIVSTDGHYFVLQGYDPASGKFDTGTTGTIYRGGSRWLSLADMQRLAGNIQGAAYIDNPASPAPSVAQDPRAAAAAQKAGAGRVQNDLAMPTPPDTSTDNSTYGPFDPPGYRQDQPTDLTVTPADSTTGNESASTQATPVTSTVSTSVTPLSQTLDPGGTGQPRTGDFPSEPVPAGTGNYIPPASPEEAVAREPSSGGIGGVVASGLAPGGPLASAVASQAPVAQMLQLEQEAQDAEARGDQQRADELRAQQNEILNNMALNLVGSPEAVGGMGRFYGRPVEPVPGGHLGGTVPEPQRGSTTPEAALGMAPELVPADRYYHGSGSAFDTPDPAKFDENGLFGPGYYLTSDPRVAGSGDLTRPGYAEQAIGADSLLGSTETRLENLQNEARGLRTKISDLENGKTSFAHLAPDFQPNVPNLLQNYRARLATLDQYIADDMRLPGPNVRAVDVPRGLRLLNVEGPLSIQDKNAIAKGLSQYEGSNRLTDTARSFLRDLSNYNETSRAATDAHGWLEDRFDGDNARVNGILQVAGFDGIRYDGGKLIPMKDENGADITHQVTVIFPNSLPKITNAISGAQGGQIQAGLATRLGGAAAGGLIGSTQGDTPEEKARNAAIGAGVGLGLGHGVVRLADQLANPMTVHAAYTPPTQWSDPNNRNLSTMFSRPVPTPATTTPWYRRLAQGMTDDKALLNGWEQEIRTRLGANAPPTEIISHLLRVNPDSIASQRMRPVMDEVRTGLEQAQVSPSDLSVYLANVHDVDIAQAFGDRAYDAAIAAGQPQAAAQAAFDAAANGRVFPGGRHVQDIVAQLQSGAADLGPTKMQAVHDAAQRIWDMNAETRDRLYAAGGMDSATHAQMVQDYPHYVTTDIVNHIDPETGNAGGGGGGSVSQRQNAFRTLSAAGTASDRLDPLQSVAMNTVRSERWIAKNAAFGSFYDLVNADPALATQLGVTPSKPGGTKEVTGLVNGQRETLRVARPIAEVLEMGNSTAMGLLGEILKKITGPFKAGLTTYAAPFQYLVNPLRDSSDFFARQSAYMGGPQHLPEVVAAYARAIPDVFSGLLHGEYTGPNTTAYHMAGGSYERIDTSPAGIASLTKRLTATGGEQLRDPRRIASLVRDVLTLGARPMGERIEQIPRVAAFDLAQRGGASPTRAMIAGRDSTVAFEQGGRWVKALNTAVPFLNASMQATAQLGRAFRDHPVAATASMATVVGIPALVAEAWNRSDPERQAAYDDVPSYLKNSGIVFMLPGVSGSDQRGNLPNYVWIPTGIFTPGATSVRAITQRVMKDASPEDFGKMLSGVLSSYSPVKDVSSLVTPGLSTVMDLKGNRDMYRGRTIATDAADRNAGALAKTITGALNAVGAGAAQASNAGVPLVGNVAGLRDIRPSQTEYTIRDLTGSPGQEASAAADMLAGRDTGRNRPIQDVPVLGGIAGRVVRDTGGQQLQNAEDVRIAPETDAVLRDAGLRPNDVITPVGSMAKGVPLDREQQVQWQELTNTFADRAILAVQRSPGYRNPATQQQAIRDALTQARDAAADRVLARIPSSQQARLKREALLQKAG